MSTGAPDDNEKASAALEGVAADPEFVTSHPPLAAKSGSAQNDPPSLLKGPPAAASSSAARKPRWIWQSPAPSLPEARKGLWQESIDGIFESKDLPNNAEFLGAAVRGRSHKQDALYCDDSFSFLDVGSWKVVLVSDGAGSAGFSRVGSQLACDAVLEVFSRELPEADLSDHTLHEAKLREFSTTPEADPILGRAATVFERAFANAHDAIRKWVDEQNRESNDGSETRRWIDQRFRGTGKESSRIIQERPEAPLGLLERDCNCTLLVVAYSVAQLVKTDGTRHQLALSLSCAIGDGMMVVFRRTTSRPTVITLMRPDAGEFAGQTQFVDAKTTAAAFIRGRLKMSFLGNPNDVVAVVAMTDGVADDYYEGLPGMERLYCDLIANAILPPPPDFSADTAVVPDESISDGIVDEAIYDNTSLAGEGRTRKVAYCNRLKEFQSRGPGYFLGNAALLWALARLRIESEPAGYDSPSTERARRLRDWLDTYIVRGSFDDRSLSLYVQG
jgi:hypothetical protein